MVENYDLIYLTVNGSNIRTLKCKSSKKLFNKENLKFYSINTESIWKSLFSLSEVTPQSNVLYDDKKAPINKNAYVKIDFFASYSSISAIA